MNLPIFIGSLMQYYKKQNILVGMFMIMQYRIWNYTTAILEKGKCLVGKCMETEDRVQIYIASMLEKMTCFCKQH